MTTLDKLQQLNDAQFHRLADAILRRLEPRYHLLRPHGVNSTGQSIKGQPDSYVGTSARACTIAFCYTTVKARWWDKVVADIREAISTSPLVEEIVAAIPRNADREGPGKVIPWEAQAKEAAGTARFTFFDGPKLAHLLDADYQDIRYEFLSIPFSRLSKSALIASCRAANQNALDDLLAKGRYSREQYVRRQADAELRTLWAEAFRSACDATGRAGGCLIPVVGDSGLGKTSLLCSFVESRTENLPVLFIQARDCVFTSEDALVRLVIQKLQGVIDPALRIAEELAILHLAPQKRFLTVVLDGIDETRKPVQVAVAVKFWLDSRLGIASVLIVSSRPDFWRRTAAESWARYLPSSIRETVGQSRPNGDGTSSRGEGLQFRILHHFRPPEAETAWLRCGLSQSLYDRLPNEARRELRHPFTLRAYAEIARVTGISGLPRTRNEIMELWLAARLENESDPVERISDNIHWSALVAIAKSMNATGGSTISIDELIAVPRFDPTHPPGPVVERLIGANVLETIEGQENVIRFVFDAVFEFYCAESDVAEIGKDKESVITSLVSKSLTTGWTRLGRIGTRIAGSSVGDSFLCELAARDYAKALIVMQASPELFSEAARRQVFGHVASAYWKASRPEMAFIIERIGFVSCKEAEDFLASLPVIGGLEFVTTFAMIRLSVKNGVQLVARVLGHYHIYFRTFLSLIRASRKDFKAALAQAVEQGFDAQLDTAEHVRAVRVFAYLGQGLLVGRLARRLAEGASLLSYEYHALLADGSDAGAALFADAVRFGVSEVERQSEGPTKDRLWREIFYGAAPRSFEVRYLLTQDFEPRVLSLMNSPGSVSAVGRELATFSGNPSLVRELLFTDDTDGWLIDCSKLQDAISVAMWIEWWKSATTDAVKKRLLIMIGDLPDARLETHAIECLSIPSLRAAAVRALGHVGSETCLPYLRVLADEAISSTQMEYYEKQPIAYALGNLRDGSSVDRLAKLAETSQYYARTEALFALALIGTEEAGERLVQMMVDCKDDRASTDVGRALIEHGGDICMSAVLDCAGRRSDGPKWLVECIDQAFMARGRSHRGFYPLKNDAAIIDYIQANEQILEGSEIERLIWAFRWIDSGNSRRLLREWAARRGSQKVLPAGKRGGDLSALAYEALIDRGDAFSVSEFISWKLAVPRNACSRTLEELQNFRRADVADELRRRLGSAPSSSEHTARLIWMLGIAGTSDDVSLIQKYLGTPDELIRNVAFEAKWRLADPLRLAVGRHEMLVQ